MLVQRKYSDDPSILTIGPSDGKISNWLRDYVDRLPLRLYRWTRQNWWTVGWLPFDINRRVNRISPDLVQLHWIGNGGAPVKSLARLGRYPLVWTLRDMWPLTGGCHYSGGCTKFLTGCGSCPQLNSRRERDISSALWHRKHRAWQGVDVTYIALSNWMADQARRSPLTFGNEVTVIPTGIDTRRFTPADKHTARASWNLPSDKRIVLYGALMSTVDPRKGFSYLREALAKLAAQGWDRRAVLVVFGASGGDRQIGLDAHYVGYVNNQEDLARLYSCADVMVVPSLEENFGKTGIEAMSCGVPVVAFANTGQLDIVDHKVTGYLAENLSSADLANGIAWCLKQSETGDALGRQARRKVIERFDVRNVVSDHIALYQRLIARRHAAEERADPPARAACRRSPRSQGSMP